MPQFSPLWFINTISWFFVLITFLIVIVSTLLFPLLLRLQLSRKNLIVN